MYIYILFCYTYSIIEKDVIYLIHPIFKKEGVIVSITEAQKKASIEYAKRSLKRIPLDVQKEKYKQIKAAADAAGEKVNSYIKKAIDERMERDSK